MNKDSAAYRRALMSLGTRCMQGTYHIVRLHSSCVTGQHFCFCKWVRFVDMGAFSQVSLYEYTVLHRRKHSPVGKSLAAIYSSAHYPFRQTYTEYYYMPALHFLPPLLKWLT